MAHDWLEKRHNEQAAYYAIHKDPMGKSDVHVCPYRQDFDAMAFVHPGETAKAAVYSMEDAEVMVINEQLKDPSTSQTIRGVLTITAVVRYNGTLKEYNEEQAKRKGNKKGDPPAVGMRSEKETTFYNPKDRMRVIRMKGTKPNVES